MTVFKILKQIAKGIKPKPLSSMSKADKFAIEDEAFQLYSKRTDLLESGAGSVDDVNPISRVRNEELRGIVQKHGFDPDLSAMRIFNNFNTKNLKRYRGGKLTPEDKANIKKFEIGRMKKSPGDAKRAAEKTKLLEDF
tara:strand:- start:231 stop:644 length:414 start_codon:yes stop_codon:yes gene_type:complete